MKSFINNHNKNPDALGYVKAIDDFLPYPLTITSM